MRKRTSSWAAVVALALLLGIPACASAQVVEERRGESNPSVAIFRSTLYGAGTGLVLGGAYALVEDDEDLDTVEILQWGVAGGAAAGFLIGLVYVVSRPEPRGDVEEYERFQPGSGEPRLSAPRLMLVPTMDRDGDKKLGVGMRLVHVTF